ncbi:hypothetical protein HJC23_010332 [Cyclotella cryptica]|uniref:Fe-S metabolism associated domain-containing protein n=1 Tax=Cyclotella cryptica TaxID=29204 RepID=A0ABD3QPD1_9STRA|eukprot:CCRYP_003746-RA/>CCRYP_003746-RA protein AED:0.27 eAED:0.27 QI:0/-1/0/1/-1/1/1/0/348
MRRTKPFIIAGIPIAGIVALARQPGTAAAWAPTPPAPTRPLAFRSPSSSSYSRNLSQRSPSLPTQLRSSSIDLDSLHLTPELLMMTDAFSAIPDEKTRHKQLLYMASKLPDVDDSVRIPENKVPGCLSTVHVDCKAEKKGDDYVVQYFGDSDGLLTKGLLALLVRGLSGCTPEEINAVDPQFIQAAKISQSLTPGRNNGFLNMLVVMKKKAVEAVEKEKSGVIPAPADSSDAANGDTSEDTANSTNGIVTSFDPIEGKPMYNAILSKLMTVLKPMSITLTDNSSQHAEHGGSKGWAESGESHFSLEVVAEAFEGLSLVKRHKLIYMLLGDIMQKIHALEIKAKTPSEV